MQGNLLLDHVVGADVRFITAQAYQRRGELMRAWASELAASGERAYVIPEGGSDEVGCWGYVRGLDEALSQAREQGIAFDTIVHAAGSGGTSAGLALGKKLSGFGGTVLGFAVCDDAAYFREVSGRIIERAIGRYGLSLRFSRDELAFDDGFVGAGYAQTRPHTRHHWHICAFANTMYSLGHAGRRARAQVPADVRDAPDGVRGEIRVPGEVRHEGPLVFRRL